MGGGFSVDMRTNNRWAYLGDAGSGSGDEELDEGVEVDVVEARDGL